MYNLMRRCEQTCGGLLDVQRRLDGKLTIAVDGAVRTRLLAVTLDLLSPTLVAGSGDSPALLDGLRGDITSSSAVINVEVGFYAVGWGGCILDGPVCDGQRGRLVVGHGESAVGGAEARIRLAGGRNDDGAKYVWGKAG